MVFSSCDGPPHLRWSSPESLSIVCQQLVALLPPTQHLGACLPQSGSTLCVQFLLLWVTTLWLGAGLPRRVSTVCDPVDTTRQTALGVTPFCAVFPTVLPAFPPAVIYTGPSFCWLAPIPVATCIGCCHVSTVCCPVADDLRLVWARE